MTDLEAEELKLSLEGISKKLNEVSKQYSGIQKTLDLIYEDRDLLTDLGNDVSQVRRLVLASDKNNEKLTSNVIKTVEKETEMVKAEVAVTSEQVENKVKITIQSITHSILNGLHHSLKKDGKKLSFRSRLARLFSFKRSVNLSV